MEGGDSADAPVIGFVWKQGDESVERGKQLLHMRSAANIVRRRGLAKELGDLAGCIRVRGGIFATNAKLAKLRMTTILKAALVQSTRAPELSAEAAAVQGVLGVTRRSLGLLPKMAAKMPCSSRRVKGPAQVPSRWQAQQ